MNSFEDDLKKYQECRLHTFTKEDVLNSIVIDGPIRVKFRRCKRGDDTKGCYRIFCISVSGKVIEEFTKSLADANRIFKDAPGKWSWHI
jgi:hypothetical protein